MTADTLRPFVPFRSALAHLIDLGVRAGQIVRTLAAPFHFAICGSTPCVCTWPDGLSDTYTVNGTEALSPCPECDASSDVAWDGTLHHTGGACVWWAADATFDPLSINGSQLDIVYTQVLLNTGVTPCRWELYVACTSAVNPTQTIWAGYKTGGATPVGTYSRVSSDCGNTTPTIDVT